MNRSSLSVSFILLCAFVCYAGSPDPADLNQLVRDCTALFREKGSVERLNPADSLPDSVHRLHPQFVYFEGHGAVVIVQAWSVMSERGIYVHLPISSQMRTMENKNPPWHYKHLGKGVYKYERSPKA